MKFFKKGSIKLQFLINLMYHCLYWITIDNVLISLTPIMTPILLRIILTILFLWFISIQVEWPSVIEIFLSIKWWWIIVAILLQVLIFIIGAIRWWAFFCHGHSSYTLRQLIAPYFIGALFNNFLPTSTGGDALRIYHIYISKDLIIRWHFLLLL